MQRRSKFQICHCLKFEYFLPLKTSCDWWKAICTASLKKWFAIMLSSFHALCYLCKWEPNSVPCFSNCVTNVESSIGLTLCINWLLNKLNAFCNEQNCADDAPFCAIVSIGNLRFIHYLLRFWASLRHLSWYACAFKRIWHTLIVTLIVD